MKFDLRQEQKLLIFLRYIRSNMAPSYRFHNDPLVKHSQYTEPLFLQRHTLDEFVDLPQLKQASVFLIKIGDGSGELNSFVEAPFCPAVHTRGEICRLDTLLRNNTKLCRGSVQFDMLLACNLASAATMTCQIDCFYFEHLGFQIYFFIFKHAGFQIVVQKIIDECHVVTASRARCAPWPNKRAVGLGPQISWLIIRRFIP